jgi:hypothetical protein
MLCSEQLTGCVCERLHPRNKKQARTRLLHTHTKRGEVWRAQTFPNAIALAPSLQSPGAPLATGPTTVVTVAVPDEHIGAVVGKGGKYISEMQQVAGVRIKISDRTDYVPGTRNRKVTLTGTLEAVQIAQFLISQKVQQSAAEMQSNPQR